jgi:hypothetical protein
LRELFFPPILGADVARDERPPLVAFVPRSLLEPRMRPPPLPLDALLHRATEARCGATCGPAILSSSSSASATTTNSPAPVGTSPIAATSPAAVAPAAATALPSADDGVHTTTRGRALIGVF